MNLHQNHLENPENQQYLKKEHIDIHLLLFFFVKDLPGGPGGPYKPGLKKEKEN